MGKVKVTDFELIIHQHGLSNEHTIHIVCPIHGTFDEPLVNVQEIVDQMTNHLIKENH